MSLWLKQIRMGYAYSGRAVRLPTDIPSGHFAHTQLWNPSDSGVDAYVYMVQLGWYSYKFSFHDSALPTLDLSPLNLITNGANAKCEIRTGTAASEIGNVFYFVSSKHDRHGIYPPRDGWGAILKPGMGLVQVQATIDTGVITNYLWSEVPLS